MARKESGTGRGRKKWRIETERGERRGKGKEERKGKICWKRRTNFSNANSGIGSCFEN